MSRGVCRCASCEGRAPDDVRPLSQDDGDLLESFGLTVGCYFCGAAPAPTCSCPGAVYVDAVGLPGELDADEARDRAEVIRDALRFAGLVALEDDPSPASAPWAWGKSEATDALLRAAVEQAEAAE